jgi:hypothetical protein
MVATAIWPECERAVAWMWRASDPLALCTAGVTTTIHAGRMTTLRASNATNMEKAALPKMVYRLLKPEGVSYKSVASGKDNMCTGRCRAVKAADASEEQQYR